MFCGRLRRMPPSASRTSSEESASGPKRGVAESPPGLRRKHGNPLWPCHREADPAHVPSEAEDSEEVVSHHPAPHPQVFENGGGSMKEQPYILQFDRRTFYGCHGRTWQGGVFRWDYRKASSFYHRFICIYGLRLGVATKRQVHLVERGKPRVRKKWLRIIRRRTYRAFGMKVRK